MSNDFNPSAGMASLLEDIKEEKHRSAEIKLIEIIAMLKVLLTNLEFEKTLPDRNDSKSRIINMASSTINEIIKSYPVEH
jgi:hypothetical protein